MPNLTFREYLEERAKEDDPLGTWCFYALHALGDTAITQRSLQEYLRNYNVGKDSQRMALKVYTGYRSRLAA